MFFIRTCKLLAILALLSGSFQILLGLLIATEAIGPYELALKHFSTAKSSGEIIDKGVRTLLVAIVLGVLAEIGTFVAKASDK